MDHNNPAQQATLDPFVVWSDGKLFTSLDNEPVAYGYSTHFTLPEIVAAGVNALLLAKGIAPELAAQRAADAAEELTALLPVVTNRSS